MTGYCKWCDTRTNSIVKVYDSGKLIWVGCLDCRTKRNEKISKSDVMTYHGADPQN